MFLALAALSLALPACGPALTPEPDPTPAVISIQITPALNTLRPLFKSCASEQPQIGLVVFETLTPDPGQANLAFRWGASRLPGGFAAVSGWDALVFAAHPSNPLSQISLTDLKEIYMGTRLEWPAGGPAGEIRPWAYPAEEDIQQIFVEAAGESFAAGASSLAPDPAAMLEAVSGDPNAIGFLPRRWLNEQVKELHIEGLEANRLRQPILVLSQSEPAGAEKSWLLCLQENLTE